MVPASNRCRISPQCLRKYPGSSSTLIPSMPGLPLFCRTRFNAPTRLARPTTSSIRRCSLPERSSPWATVPASPLPSTFGASPLSSSGSSSCLDSWRMAFSRSTVVTLSSPFGPSSDKAGSKRIMHFVGLLWPLLTSRSAGRPNSAMPASPFQASGETSPGKNDDLPRTIAGSTPLPLGRRSFAVSGPLAPVRSASYPVPVRRLTGSFHASFSVRLTTNALRFPSVPATRFREDFHLQVIAHAGPTTTETRSPLGDRDFVI